jgi:hypothetical protein
MYLDFFCPAPTAVKKIKKKKHGPHSDKGKALADNALANKNEAESSADVVDRRIDPAYYGP